MTTRTLTDWQTFIEKCREEFTPKPDPKPEQPKPTLGSVIILDQLTTDQARLLLEYYPHLANELGQANPEAYKAIYGKPYTRPTPRVAAQCTAHRGGALTDPDFWTWRAAAQMLGG